MKTIIWLGLLTSLLVPVLARAQESTFDVEDLELPDDPVVEDDDVQPLLPPASPPAPSAGSRPTPLDEARLRDALARYAHSEPSVDDVVAAALRAQAADPARTRDALARVRLSGWVPTVRVGVRRGFGEGLTAQDLATGDRTAISTSDSLSLDGSLTFRLDRLVFAREETALMREERSVARERLRLAHEVVALWFERRRLQLERDLLGATDLAHALAIAEASSMLDVFTAGAFTRMMRDRRPPRDGHEAR